MTNPVVREYTKEERIEFLKKEIESCNHELKLQKSPYSKLLVKQQISRFKRKLKELCEVE